MGWKAAVTFPAGTTELLLLHSVQTVFGTHLASYTTSRFGSFTGGKAAGA
jgi:hypothetical protein